LAKRLAEALEQQEAISEVLQIISGSPGELQPVFDAVLAHATRLCDAKFASLLLREANKPARTAVKDMCSSLSHLLPPIQRFGVKPVRTVRR
jgi:hypothetical protein